MSISVDWNILLCIIIIAALLLVIAILISKEIRYYTKRKFDSIEEYNRLQADIRKTYKESQEQYSQNMKDSGIENKHENTVSSKVIKIWKIIRGSE